MNRTEQSESEAGDRAGGRYDDAVQRLREAVLSGSGSLDAEVRWAIEARAARQSGRGGDGHLDPPEVPAALTRFVDTVTRGAWRVTPEDIDGLRRAGYTEDQIFEITVSAALGAASGRLERATAAMRGED